MNKTSSYSCRAAGGVLAAATLVLSACGVAAAPPGPEPQVPAGGGPPGPFPNTTVSGVNVIARGSTTFNGNVEIQAYAGNGPVPWTVTKYNRGDIAMRLSPANPSGADANTLNKGFIDYTSPNDAAAAENQAWRPHPRLGVAIPTARQNGPVDWGDGEGGFYPTVAISGASSGSGYSMVDGTFGTGQLDINLGRAGTHASSPEANFAFSVTWFPYDAGWLAGNVGNPGADGAPVWNGAGEHAAGLAAGLVKWHEVPIGSFTFGGVAELRLPGVNAFTNGMLFATSSQGNSDVNIVGVAPTNDTATGSSFWIVTVREDSSVLPEEVAMGQSQFYFVYVPYDARNLVGGYINGTTGAKIQSAGDFTMSRSGAGTYELSIPGKVGTSGALLLQAADFEPATSQPMATRAFLSYEYNTASGKFIIQSRKTTSDTVADLADANFYVVWVDFANPLSPPDGPRMRMTDAVPVTDALVVAAKEGNLAVNTDEPEVLVTTVDQFNAGGYTDPTTGVFAQQALVGYFHDPRTLAQTRGPFLLMANSAGAITRHDVKYNPVSKQYVVVGNARTHDGVLDYLMISRVNPNSAAGAGEPLVNCFLYDGVTNGASYDDVSVAVSSGNGNFVVVAEHKDSVRSTEDVYGAMFSSSGAVLTPAAMRLDTLQGDGDEDDPDVVYLPAQDVFLYVGNTDMAGGALTNRIAGKVIQTTVAAGQLQVSGPEQLLAVNSGPNQGHPSAIENPFNGQLLAAFDIGGNDQPTGQLSYHTIGAAPSYAFTQARPQVAYLAGSGGNPLRHQHPQLAADPSSGAILLGFQARNSSVGLPNGYVFMVLDRDGVPMPSQLNAPYYLGSTPGAVPTDPNFHNVKYSPASDSFLAVYTADDTLGGNRQTYLASLWITSSHLEAPSLQIAAGPGGDLVLSWPASGAGYVLESKTVLGPGAWTDVPGTPQFDGQTYRQTVQPAETGFYRLRR